MRKILLLVLFIISLTLAAFAADNKEKITITTLVNHWNDLHNSKNINAFYEVYDPSVLFYGKQSSRLVCINSKSKGLLMRDFNQQIISAIEISYYNSGIIKADFRKKVATAKNVKEYNSYLLFEKKNDKYMIIGESDLDTDRNIGFVLNIGERVEQSSENASYVLIIGSIVLVAGGAFYFIRRKRKTEYPSDLLEDGKTASLIPLNKQIPKSEPENQLSDAEKGKAFENWIVERFDRQYFDLLEWRSDKMHGDRYALSNMNPDLEFKFKGKKIVEFAVECKWRKDFYNNQIEWAKDYQVRNYKTYEKNTKKPVFIVLGIGGTPSNPGNIYIIPLRQIHSNYLGQYQLDKCKRYNKGNFFFNPFIMELS